MNEEPEGSPSFPHQLLTAVQEFQIAFRDWEQADPENEKEHRRVLLMESYARLWPMLIQVVEPLARRWVRAHQKEQQLTDNWEQSKLSLCISYCLSIIDELPRTDIRADGNIVALLRKIARLRMIDDYRRQKRQEGAQEAEPEARGVLSPGQVFTTRALDEEILRTVPDEFSAEIFAHVDEADHRRMVVDAILSYWRSVLSADDRLIMELRLREPQVPYDAIASQLGSTWTAVSARQRFSRTCRRTLQHLRAIGLLSDE